MTDIEATLRGLSDRSLIDMINATQNLPPEEAEKGLPFLRAEAKRRNLSLSPAQQSAPGPLLVIPGRKSGLAPLAKAHAPILFRWLNEREPDGMAGGYTPMSEELFGQWFAEKSRQPHTMFVLIAADTGTPIGYCGLHQSLDHGRFADLSIRICRPEYIGRGFGTDAVNQLLSVGFDDLNLARIQLTVRSDNARAIASYKKAGFVEEGLLKSAGYSAGAYRDMVIMAVLRK